MAWLDRTAGVRNLPCRRDFFLFLFLFILGAVHGEHERHSAKHRQNRSHKRSFLYTGKLFISFTFQLGFPVVRRQAFFLFSGWRLNGKSRAASSAARQLQGKDAISSQSHGLQSRLVHGGCDRQAMVSLESCQCSPGLRPQNSINRSGVITLAAQDKLHIDDYLVGRETGVTGVDWPVIPVPGIRIVAPARIPIAGVPVPPAAKDKDDARVMSAPPIAVMPLSLIMVKGGVSGISKTIRPPVIGNPRVRSPIIEHVASKRKVALPVPGQIPPRSRPTGPRNLLATGFRKRAIAPSSGKRLLPRIPRLVYSCGNPSFASSRAAGLDFFRAGKSAFVIRTSAVCNSPLTTQYRLDTASRSRRNSTAFLDP